jgi:hypothetical protein
VVPAFLLGVAVSTFFTDSRPSGLPFVPRDWLPTDPIEQFVLLIGLLAASNVLGALLGWVNSWA